MTEKAWEIEPEEAETPDPDLEASPDLEDQDEEGPDFQDPVLPIEDVDDLLSPDRLEEEGEPDDDTLSREEQDLAELVKDEPLELLENPVLMMELSEFWT